MGRGLPSSICSVAALRAATSGVPLTTGLGGESSRVVNEEFAGLPAVAASVASEAKRASRVGGSNSVVESQPSKLLVAGSIPVSRSNLRSWMQAKVAHHSAKREGGPTTRVGERRLAGQTPLRRTG